MAVAGAHWQFECENVEQKCAYLLRSGQCTDCAFMVGLETNHKVFHAHKHVLAKATPVFHAMLFGGLSERNDPIVPIPNIQPEAFRTMLQYIYTGNININSFDMAMDVWHGANMYDLPHLEKQCTSYIYSVVGPSNACRAYEHAHLFEEKTIVDKCVEIISTNTKEVLNDSSFLDVQLNTLITVCSLDHLNVDSELDLFHAVARYAEAEQRRQGQISPPVEGGPSSEELTEEKEQCFEAGSLEHTINALRCGDPSQVKDAARAAVKIMRDSKPLDIQLALDKGILDALVPALTEGSNECKEHAARAIYWLCDRGSPAQLRVLAASAALQPYCRLLPAAEDTCYWVMYGLTDMLKKVEQNAKPDLLQKLRALGVPQLLTTVRGGGDVTNRGLANNLLQMYFHNDQ